MNAKLANAVGLILVLEAQTAHTPDVSPEEVTLCKPSRAQLEEALKEEAPEVWEEVERALFNIIPETVDGL